MLDCSPAYLSTQNINRDWKNIRKAIKITMTVISGIYESNQRKSCCNAEFKKLLDKTKQTVFCYEIQATFKQTFCKQSVAC